MEMRKGFNPENFIGCYFWRLQDFTVGGYLSMLKIIDWQKNPDSDYHIYTTSVEVFGKRIGKKYRYIIFNNEKIYPNYNSALVNKPLVNKSLKDNVSRGRAR